ncbi:MAG: hypothetical protein M3R06_03420 [Chloroflexota bacterium]|nr:hypothetical protein [Chloroflexota bacterium]
MPQLSRRRLLQGFGATAIGLLPATRALDALAGIGWCRADPVFSLDGKVGHVFFAAALEDWEHNTSSIDVLILHPPECATNVIAIDSGFGQGMSVNFAESAELRKLPAGYEIEVQTYVPANRGRSVRVLVEFGPGDGSVITASVVGRANTWITIRALLP